MLKTPIADIKLLMDEYHRSYQGKSDRECVKLAEPYEKLQFKVAKLFGDLNGWKLSEQGFAPAQIGKTGGKWDYTHRMWSDHPLYYRAKNPLWKMTRPIAIIGQPYNQLSSYQPELDALAKAHNLKWKVPPKPRASIWYPGSTLFIVLTLPEHKIVWLPDQLEDGK